MKKPIDQEDPFINELKHKFLNENLNDERIEIKSRNLFQLTGVLTAVFTLLFSSYLLFSTVAGNDDLLFSFSTNRQNELSRELSLLKSQTAEMQEAINTLQKQLDVIKNQPSENRDITTINIELARLDSNLSSLNDTILEKPDTAITAKLLREKQNAIDQKLLDITISQQRLEDRTDNFLSNLIAVPVYAAIAGLVFTVIAAVTSPFLTKLKERFLPKPAKTVKDD